MGSPAVQNDPTTSPPSGEPRACQVSRVMLSLTKRELPSPSSTWTPPWCMLRDETMLLRLLYAVWTPMHGARGTETQSTLRSWSGLLVLGVKFQWNRQFSG